MKEKVGQYNFSNLEEMIEFAKEGIVSKTIVDESKVKVVLFCMSKGQALSEHTASVPATIHILRGEGKVILDKKEFKAIPGAYVFMPKNQLHALEAQEDMVFLLHMMKND